MPGRRQKKPDDLQGHRQPARLQVVPPGETIAGDVIAPGDKPSRAAPPPPMAFDRGPLREDVQQFWRSFWGSTPAFAVDREAHLPLLIIGFQSLNEFFVVSEVAASARLVRGSMGQARLTPMYEAARDQWRRWLAVCDRFGMSPLAVFHLGTAAGEAEDVMEQFQAALDAAAARTQEMPEEYR